MLSFKSYATRRVCSVNIFLLCALVVYDHCLIRGLGFQDLLFLLMSAILSYDSNCNQCFLQDMWLYLSEHEKFNDFGNDKALYWHETNIPYAVWTPESIRSKSLTYYPSEV